MLAGTFGPLTLARFGMLSEMRFAVAAGIVIVAVLSACVPVVSRRPGRTESRG